MASEFEKNFDHLNDAQKSAVLKTDGAVLVVAGPGTGKTQLLAMRAANIVRTSDTPPSSILCLTFTESARSQMQSRLVKLMGKEGNQVQVHTFHSFGSEIINANPEFFYQGANFSPASEVEIHEIITSILESLPHSNPLVKKMNGEFTATKHIISAVGSLKRSGLSPDELVEIIENNKVFFDFIGPDIRKIFANKITKSIVPDLHNLIKKISDFQNNVDPNLNVTPISTTIVGSLERAMSDFESSGKTNSITLWKNQNLRKNELGDFVFKDYLQTQKLLALADVFKKYHSELESRELFDFDDMISRVTHVIETNSELKYNLQEKYLYIMVDEFQDTNGAQMRLLRNITDNSANEGDPNIMAVGDDDQAIYAFQGAEISNILDFSKSFKNPTLITLTKNYRSTRSILDLSRNIITLGEERLENSLKSLSKKLSESKTQDYPIELHEFAKEREQHQWIVDKIAALIQAGEKPNEIVVLARKHRHLLTILPYFAKAKIAVNYEKRSNVIESDIIRQLITLAEVVVALSKQRFEIAEEKLPELLSYDFWQVDPVQLWKLSLTSYKENRLWLEIMLESSSKLRSIAEFLILCSKQSLSEPLEKMLDTLIGSHDPLVPEDFADDTTLSPIQIEKNHSPLKDFYFNKKSIEKTPEKYLQFLSELKTLHQAIRKWHFGEHIKLEDFVGIIDLHKKAGIEIVNTFDFNSGSKGVNLLTAHKAKGLEFKHVFVIDAQDNIWGRSARAVSRQISFPLNLPIDPAGDKYDEALRLFYVAMTRAEDHLYITSYQEDSDGKQSQRAEFLQIDGVTMQTHADMNLQDSNTEGAVLWTEKYLSLPRTGIKNLLAPTLENYMLSATHLNNFIDVSRGGPQSFLLQNLLRFPQMMTPEQVFGQVVHRVLSNTQNHLSQTGNKKPLEDILKDFEGQLINARLTEHDFNYLLQKGSDILPKYLAENYANFSRDDRSERNFNSQNVVIDNCHLTGAIDIMRVNKDSKTITVIDFKTGKPADSWKTSNDFEKIKLHKYKQQLMFYKLLIENSRDWSGYKVDKAILDFIEPSNAGKFCKLEFEFNDAEITEFRKLIKAVWQSIMDLDLPDTSTYTPNYKGVLEFEKYLLSQNIT